MPVDLKSLVTPAHTAIVTCEMQRGAIGDIAPARDLADEVALPRVSRRPPRWLDRQDCMACEWCTPPWKCARQGWTLHQ